MSEEHTLQLKNIRTKRCYKCKIDLLFIEIWITSSHLPVSVSNLLLVIAQGLVDNAHSSIKDAHLNASSTDDLNYHHHRRNSESITFEDVNQQNSDDQIAEHSNQIRGNEAIEQETSNFEFISNVPERENNGIRNLTENGAAVESVSLGHVREDHEPFHDNDAPRSETSDTHEVYGHSHGLIRSTFEDYEWQVLSSQAEDPQDVVTDHEERNLRQLEAPYELVIEHGESEKMSSSEHNETTKNTTEDMSGSWQEDSANHLRCVSNLLQSVFCESLDQLIQSYVERQGHTFEWYMDGKLSSPDDMEHELLQEYDNHDGPQINSESNSFSMTSLHVEPYLQFIGTDWEVIHELSNDMVRLQQRMDNIQRMFEKCMEMQYTKDVRKVYGNAS
ncbi:hypothetical protein KY285_023634 [Solanum tuberosum]|nr:hypothetical protein KY289_023964 [Solanum tuberosum]KAH0675833.1 hypothetical protein KY285_023634 [Solanum tuberosum]